MSTITNEQKAAIASHSPKVVGEWLVIVQNAMPAEIRDSRRWGALLPLAAGTGRKHERECLALVLDWMWSTVLPTLQPTADEYGFGVEWQRMVAERTAESATVATAAAVQAARAAAKAARPAEPPEWAAWAAGAAAKAQKGKQKAKAAKSAALTATTAAWAMRTTRVQAQAQAQAAWAQFDPCGLLERLVAVSAS